MDIDQNSSSMEEALILKEKGNSCYRDGNYKAAINFYTKAIDKCKKSNTNELAIFYQNRAAAHEMIENWNEVVADCSKSLKYNPTYAKAYFRRAKGHENTRKIIDCLEDATAAVILEKIQNKGITENIQAYNERIQVAVARAAANKDIASRKPKLQSSFFVYRFFKLFIEDPIHKEISQIDNSKGYIRAKIAFDEENYDDIIAACSEEIESSPDAQYRTEALLFRGAFHVLSGSFDKGRKDYDAVINDKKAKNTVRANAILKKIMLNMHLMEKPLEPADFKEAEKEFPNNPDLHNLRGQMYLMRYRFSEAVDDFTKALQLVPNHIVTYVRKCCAQYSLDLNHEKFINVMKKIDDKQSEGDCLECYFLIGEALCENGRFEEANLVYVTAIKHLPRQAMLYTLRGRLLMKWKKDFKTAIQLMSKAIELDDTCKIAHSELAQLENAVGNVGRAVVLFDKAIALSQTPEDIFVMHKLRNSLVAEVKVCTKLGVDRKLDLRK